MKNGLYLIASLDGAPLDERDCLVMGLDRDAADRALPAGARLHAHDLDVGAVHVRRDAAGAEVLMGYLDEPAELAAALGLDARISHLVLATAAVDRFGERAPGRMAGSWTFARWHGERRELTVLIAERVRDTVFLATDGKRVAIAPEPMSLARLGWVDGGLDPEGFLFGVGRAALRARIGQRTSYRGVLRLEPGTQVIVTASGIRTSTAEPLVAAAPKSCSFEEATEEIEAVLRRIVRQELGRHRSSAFMLSGGLDSSLLTWLGAEERASGQSMICLSSASPPGSGIADETRYARVVADHLGLPIVPVWPAATADIYRPTKAMLCDTGEPSLSVRHYLYAAFFEAAAGVGASVLFDGGGGEMSVTNHASFFQPTPWRQPARQAARIVRDWTRRSVERMREGPTTPGSQFHVRLSRHGLAQMPAAWSQSGGGQQGTRRIGPDGAFGIEWGAAKPAGDPSATVEPGLRVASPFFDRRLLSAFSAFPASITLQDGLARAPARRMLKGRLPDSIRLTPSKMPFSPTYKAMMRDQAPAARTRIIGYRAAGVEAWLDLAWLDAALARISTEANPTLPLLFQAQLTAMIAEYLLWRARL